jgi:hemerythrin-like domain-containing protein
VKQALDVIKSEHRSLAAILHAMNHLVQRVRDGGGPPDFGAFHTMIYYIDAFSERLHHPKEDEFLFQPLHARTSDADEIIGELGLEHVRGAAAIRSVEQALLRYEAGGEREFVAFATAVEGFCDFYFRHMHKEETLVIPLAERLFTDQDWERIDAAFVANRDPLADADEEQEFRHLLSRVVGQVPVSPGAGTSG